MGFAFEWLFGHWRSTDLNRNLGYGYKDFCVFLGPVSVGDLVRVLPPIHLRIHWWLY